MYSTNTLKDFHDKNSPKARDAMLMRVYEAGENTRDNIKDPTPEEIDKFYGPGSSKASYFKTHLNDIKSILTHREKTPVYVELTNAVLMRRRFLFPDADNEITKKFFAAYSAKLKQTQTVLDGFQIMIEKKQKDREQALNAYEKARSAAIHATPETKSRLASERDIAYNATVAVESEI
jgi:hypothetical protein